MENRPDARSRQKQNQTVQVRRSSRSALTRIGASWLRGNDPESRDERVSEIGPNRELLGKKCVAFEKRMHDALFSRKRERISRRRPSLKACIFDVTVTGHAGFAASYPAMQQFEPHGSGWQPVLATQGVPPPSTTTGWPWWLIVLLILLLLIIVWIVWWRRTH
jgi:hypothetical protein